MKRRQPIRRNAQVYQEACEWFVEFRIGEPDEDLRRQFHAWLQESPAHMAAYLDVSANWNETAAVDLKARWPVESLLAEAAHDAEVVTPFRTSSDRRPAFSLRRPFAAAAALVSISVLAGLLAWFNSPPTYATGVGEERSIALHDGSTIKLNSRTRVRVSYSAHQRTVELLEGQALFGVARDTARPFIVKTDSTEVRAVGTEFDVYRKNTGTIVTVVEGRVDVVTSSRDGEASATGELLSAGEQVTIGTAAKALPSPAPANVALATAWTQRRLVFAATPLREVAEEFNRYNERQLVVRDPILNDFQVDGVFSSTDPTSLIRFLRQRPEMQVRETGSEIIIAHR